MREEKNNISFVVVVVVVEIGITRWTRSIECRFVDTTHTHTHTSMNSLLRLDTVFKLVYDIVCERTQLFIIYLFCIRAYIFDTVCTFSVTHTHFFLCGLGYFRAIHSLRSYHPLIYFFFFPPRNLIRRIYHTVIPSFSTRRMQRDVEEYSEFNYYDHSLWRWHCMHRTRYYIYVKPN